MGGVLSTSFQVSPSGITGDAPVEEPMLPEPEPEIASPLPNGYVAFPDGQHPPDFNGVCTFFFEHTPGISNLEVIMDIVDSRDQIKRKNSMMLAFQDRTDLIRNLNAHKGSFQNSFTLITYEQLFYKFESFFNPVNIYFAPHVRLTNGFELEHVFVVVEEPQYIELPPPPRRPLFARLWAGIIGEPATPPPPETSSEGKYHVTLLWHVETGRGFVERTTTLSDCNVVAKEIAMP